MKDAYMTIKLDSPLRERVEAEAKKERRTLADQAAYLIEKGFLAIGQGMTRQNRPATGEVTR